MFRDRIKAAARGVAKRILLPEERASVRARGDLERSAPADAVDERVIPKLQDGDGDTPGPNHKSDIGRTWAAAQLLAGEGVFALDVRSPVEWAQGHLPGARLVPAEVLADHLALLPGAGTDVFVVVYDATGEQGAAGAAALLRDKGWARARRLVGGYAEWVQEGEEVESARPIDGVRHQIGDTARLPDGAVGVVWSIDTDGREPEARVLVGTEARRCRAAELS